MWSPETREATRDEKRRDSGEDGGGEVVHSPAGCSFSFLSSPLPSFPAERAGRQWWCPPPVLHFLALIQPFRSKPPAFADCLVTSRISEYVLAPLIHSSLLQAKPSPGSCRSFFLRRHFAAAGLAARKGFWRPGLCRDWDPILGAGSSSCGERLLCWRDRDLGCFLGFLKSGRLSDAVPGGQFRVIFCGICVDSGAAELGS